VNFNISALVFYGVWDPPQALQSGMSSLFGVIINGLSGVSNIESILFYYKSHKGLLYIIIIIIIIII